MKYSVIGFAAVLFFSCMPCSYGIEPGFYGAYTEHCGTDSDWQELVGLLQKTDRYLMLTNNGANDFEFLEVENLSNQSLNQANRLDCKTCTYTRKQLKKLLKNNICKDLLVIDTQFAFRFNCGDAREREKVFRFVDALGFKRVLFERQNLLTRQVWRDSWNESHSNNRSKDQTVLLVDDCTESNHSIDCYSVGAKVLRKFAKHFEDRLEP